MAIKMESIIKGLKVNSKSPFFLNSDFRQIIITQMFPLSIIPCRYPFKAYNCALSLNGSLFSLNPFLGLVTGSLVKTAIPIRINFGFWQVYRNVYLKWIQMLTGNQKSNCISFDTGER